jgi:hypothetical protein
VTSSEEVAFLDWENAEESGPPLWDLFALFHSLSIHAAERSARRPTPAVLVQALLTASPIAERWVRCVTEQRRALGFSGQLVGPLLLLHWMQSALREVWRLPPDRLHRGRSLEMLRRIASGWGKSEVARRASAD